MDERKEFNKGALVARAVLAVLAAAVGLSLAGCGKQMARIEENQLKLQGLVELNAQQIGDIARRIEENQQALQDAIGTVRNSTQVLAADLASVAGEHAKLQKMVRDNNLQMTDKIAMMEQRQQNLQAGIEDVRSGTVRVAADVVGLGDKQAKLEQMIEANNRTLVSKVAANVDALEQNLLKLKEVLQNDTRNLADIVQVIGQQQIEFEGKVERNIRGLAESMSAVEQNRAEFQKQVEEAQSNAQAMISNLTTALEQLKARVSQTGPLESTESAETAVSVSEVKKQD